MDAAEASGGNFPQSPPPPVLINQRGAVGGRIARFSQNWHDLNAGEWVMNIVLRGHSIEFLELPQYNGIVRTVLTGADNRKAVLAEVQSLLVKKAIERVPQDQVHEGYYSRIFTVPKKSGGIRTILNLKPINSSIRKARFKMETLRSVIRAVKPGDWLASIDLTDAYLHIPIIPSHRKYLRFAVGGQHFQYRVLPFGLTSAPRVFTKVLAPIVAEARRAGLFIYPYLDDWLMRALSFSGTMSTIRFVALALMKRGWLINVPKSILFPTQSLIFIGGDFQTDIGLVSLPGDRFIDLRDCLSELRALSHVPVRIYLRVLGLMTSTLDVVPYARLHTRPFQLHLLFHWRVESRDMSALIPLPHILDSHFLWWMDPDNLKAGVPLVERPIQVKVTSDACLKGWGAHMGSKQTQGVWDLTYSKKHINYLELEAVIRAFKVFRADLVGKKVLIECDNQTTVSYINKQGGTKSPSLCMLVWQFYQWLIPLGIEVQAVHIRGIHNTQADRLSRHFLKPTEWSLSRPVVLGLFSILGNPQIDLFASRSNAQLQVYCSRVYDQRAFHVDALQMSWDNVWGYAFPPIALIPFVLEKIRKSSRCRVLLVAPCWPGRSWYPNLLELLVDVPVQLPRLPDLLQQDQICHPEPDSLSLVGWSLSAESSAQKDFLRRLSQPYRHPSGLQLGTSMIGSGQNLVIGAKGGILIPVRHL
jgi:ribonuclease HI